MFLKSLALVVVGVSSVAGFAPSAAPGLRPASGVASVSMSMGGMKTVTRESVFRRKVAPAGQVPYSGKGQYDALAALGVKGQDPVDTSYAKPTSSFNFGGAARAPAAPQKAAPAARAPARAPVRATPKPAAATPKPAARAGATRPGATRGGLRK